MTTAYEVLADNPTCAGCCAKGDTVYHLGMHDYGLAGDDTRTTGVEHVSVTLNSDGSYPSFTIPRYLLREISK
jgi:hypothetical protein